MRKSGRLPLLIELIALETERLSRSGRFDLKEELRRRLHTVESKEARNLEHWYHQEIRALTNQGLDAEMELLALSAELPDGVSCVDAEALYSAGKIDLSNLFHLTIEGKTAKRIEVNSFLARVLRQAGVSVTNPVEKHRFYLNKVSRRPDLHFQECRQQAESLRSEVKNIEYCVGKAMAVGCLLDESIEVCLSLCKMRRMTGLGWDTANLITLALDSARAAESANLVIRCLIEKGKLAHLSADFENAKSLFEDAISAHECEDAQIAECYLNVAMIHIDLEDYEAAMEFIAKVREVFAKMTGETKEYGVLECDLLAIQISLARLRLKKAFEKWGWNGEVEAGHELRARLTSAAEAFAAAGKSIGEATCLRLLGDLAILESGDDEFLYDRAMGLCDGHLVAQANCHRGRAERMMSNGNLKAADTEMLSAFEKYRDVGADRGMAICLRRRGDLAHAQGRFEEGSGFYEEALAQFERIGDHCAAGWTRLAQLRALGYQRLMADWEMRDIPMEIRQSFDLMKEKWRMGRRFDLLKLFSGDRLRA